MKTAIIVSEKDAAGMNIKQRLISRSCFLATEEKFDGKAVLARRENENIKLYTVKEESVFQEEIDKKIDAELFIFATKHRSAAKIPSLSVHSPGNWGKAKLGGKDRELCVAPAKLLREGYLRLKKYNLQRNLGYDVVVEVTHHGPHLEKPCMFIEIGSCEEQWKQIIPAEIIADVIMELVNIKFGKNDECDECFVGVGGQHTSTNFLKVIENSDLSPSHICPKYALGNFDEEMARKAVAATYGKVTHIILDWKGMGQEKERIKGFIEKLGIPVKRTSDF